MKDSNQHFLHLVSLIVFISGMGYSIITPIIPIYADEAGASSFLIGVMVASYAVFHILAQAPGGVFADRVGPKRIIFIGLLLIAVSSFMFTLTDDVWLFILFRAIEGAGSGVIFPAASAYVFSISKNENRGQYMGTFLSSWIIGFTLGPAIGGALSDEFGIKTPFYFCTFISLIAIVLMEIILKDPEGSKEGDQPESFLIRAKRIVKAKGMPAVLFRGFTIQFNNGINMMAMALFLHEIVEMSNTLIGFLFFTEGFVMLLFTPYGGRLADRIGRKKPIIFGGFAVAIAFFLIPTITNFSHTMGSVTINEFIAIGPFTIDEFIYGCFLMGILGFGFGINSPAAMSLITETSPGKQKGTGLGVYGIITGIGFIIGPLVAGFLYEKDVSYPFRLATVMALISITFVHFFVQETAKIQHDAKKSAISLKEEAEVMSER